MEKVPSGAVSVPIHGCSSASWMSIHPYATGVVPSGS